MIRSFIILSLLLITEASAQKSPEIHDDGRVTFRCRAGNADKVQVTGQFGPRLSLTKDTSGVWSGTTEKPVTPGVYEYRLKIDGMDTVDPRNPAIKPQRWPNTSILHIPAKPPAHWDRQDIPQGIIHKHHYFSKALERWRELVVYTPPGMSDQELPVLYLAHGYSDNQRTWTEHGKAHHILDSLIHQGKARPMIVVMPDAHAIDPPLKRTDTYFPKNSEAFCRELFSDVIPLTEKHYPASSDPARRAFAGLSMGGGHALTVALQHSEHISQIGAFSAAPPRSGFPGEDAVSPLNQQLSHLWIACGDRDFLFQRNQAFVKKLNELGIDNDYHVTKDDDHSWPVWRRYLIEFLPTLFQ